MRVLTPTNTVYLTTRARSSHYVCYCCFGTNWFYLYPLWLLDWHLENDMFVLLLVQGTLKDIDKKYIQMIEIWWFSQNETTQYKMCAYLWHIL